MNRKNLTALILAGVASTMIGGVIADAAETTTLNEVTVEADRDKAAQVVAAPGGLVNETAKLGI